MSDASILRTFLDGGFDSVLWICAGCSVRAPLRQENIRCQNRLAISGRLIANSSNFKS
jgi:hypothetical protein